jgi:trimeric autotransporter adhesin
MFDRSQVYRLCGLVVLLSLATVAWSDTMTGVSSKASQGSNDSVQWSQLGADRTILASSVSATSVSGVAVNVGLAGPNSIVSAVCPASPTCSWSGTGFAAGDRVIWTSDAAAGGNGPLTLAFGRSVSGAGALIHADEPGQFRAEIQAFNGSTLLGSFMVTSNANGDAVYIGILDQTGPNITSVTFSLTACGSADANCVLSDFAVDTVFLNVPSGSFALSLTLAGTGVGTVTSSPSGINCPGTCSANFNSGTVVTLTATPASGSKFAGWSGACTGTGTCSVTMSAAKSVTATFNPSGGPAVTLSPTSLSFGTVAIGTTSAVKTVTVRNTGTATLTITTIAISGTNSGDFSKTATTCGASLAAGARCTISVDFKPAASGARSAALSITDNASGSPQQVPLSGIGTTAKLAPTSLNFGTVATGVTSAAKTVTLTNLGTTTLTITTIAISGTNSGDFSKTATTCGASLAAGARCTISVDFKPSASGARSAAVSITDNASGSPQQVPLSGIGTTAKLSPTSLNFGSVTVGTTSTAKTVTLTNVGTTTLTITGISLTGTNGGDFLQTHTCGSSLASGASCTINVQFKPTAKGTRSAALGVSDSAAGSPQQVTLSGTGA